MNEIEDKINPLLQQTKIAAIYVAKPEFISELCDELGDAVVAKIDNLVFSSTLKTNICFALDVWYEPTILSFQSISEAVRILRQAGKFWYLNPIANIRRSHLITAELRKLPELARHFPIELAIPDIGCFSLLDKNTLVYSTKREKKWPLGHCQFIEDKINPPNRAYLKLWEALTNINELPTSGATVFDLGASPGGWTYVMQSLGANVTAVDKAKLDPQIARLPNVKVLQQSAFALDPATIDKKVDWLLSDIACYPDRLYELAMRWIEAKGADRMIFTIKLQGETDLAMIQKFKNIPHGHVQHLYHNKHEATFFYLNKR